MWLRVEQQLVQNGPNLLNSSLPKDIRVFAIKRVVGWFICPWKIQKWIKANFIYLFIRILQIQFSPLRPRPSMHKNFATVGPTHTRCPLSRLLLVIRFLYYYYYSMNSFIFIHTSVDKWPIPNHRRAHCGGPGIA